MSQSQQDDHYLELEAFAEACFINLVLASLKRKLTDDEANLIHLAAQLANPFPHWSVQQCGEAGPRA